MQDHTTCKRVQCSAIAVTFTLPPSRVATSSAHAGKTLIRLVTLPTGAANLLIMHAPHSTLHTLDTQFIIILHSDNPKRELGQLAELLLQMYIDNLFLSGRSALGTRREMGKMENGGKSLAQSACGV